MKNTANTNVSFSFLKHSSEFLNLILNNINACVLMLDKEMRIQAFNDAMKTIFPYRNDENITMVKCGEAIGCAYQVEEMTECGKTSQCMHCELRLAAIESYLHDQTVFKEHIVKPFFTEKGKKVDKHLQFSTRLFEFDHEKYIILIIEDISHISQVPPPLACSKA